MLCSCLRGFTVESSESQNSLNKDVDFSFRLLLTRLEEKLVGLFQMEERPNKLRTVFTVLNQFNKLFGSERFWTAFVNDPLAEKVTPR